MDKKSDVEIRGEIDLSFQNFLYQINLWTLISNSQKSIDILRKLTDAYFYSDRQLKIPRILITGNEGKTTTSHALVTSLNIERVTFVEGKYLDSPGFSISSKYVFENGIGKAIIIGNIEHLRGAESTIWQYLTFGKCSYYKYQGDWEIIHYDGILILTANKKASVPKEILKQVDVIIELQPYEDYQIRQILEQRLKYMKIVYDEQVLNLLLNSRRDKIGKLGYLIQLLKLCVISLLSRDSGANELFKTDVEWALEHYK